MSVLMKQRHSIADMQKPVAASADNGLHSAEIRYSGVLVD